MTDKQIIIDGVDVSECKFYDGEFEYSCMGSCIICERNSENCYYKQLKRKEQECEKLEKRISNYKCPMHKNADYCGYLEEGGRLKVELDLLKEDIERLKRKIIEIFACLIKANRAKKIFDTLWVNDIITLWDYIAVTLGIEGDQTQIEEQVLQNERGTK